MNRAEMIVTFEKLMGDVVAEFKEYCEITKRDHRLEERYFRILHLHYTCADGELSGIRKTFVELDIDSLDYYFDYEMKCWRDITNIYNDYKDNGWG